MATAAVGTHPTGMHSYFDEYRDALTFVQRGYPPIDEQNPTYGPHTFSCIEFCYTRTHLLKPWMLDDVPSV